MHIRYDCVNIQADRQIFSLNSLCGARFAWPIIKHVDMTRIGFTMTRALCAVTVLRCCFGKLDMCSKK